MDPVPHPVADALSYLAGEWTVRRELRDRAAGHSGWFTGRAEFRRDGTGTEWLHVEEGVLESAGLRELGADRVLTDLAGTEYSFDFVLDTVAGPLLAQAWHRLAEGGTIHLVGYSSGQDTTFPSGALFGFGESRSITTYGDMTPTSEDLTDLLGLVAAGRLSVPVGLRGSWLDVDDAVQALFARKVHGKIVLDVV